MPARPFLDTCALCKRYVAEAGSETMRAIVGTEEFRGRLFVSDHIEGEIFSALNAIFRRGHLTRKALRTARGDFRMHYPDIFAVVERRLEIDSRAIELLNKYPKLRITHPDAIHIAAAEYVTHAVPGEELVIVSSDKGLKELAHLLRFQRFDPELHPLRDLA